MTLAFLPPCVLGMKMYYLGLKVFMLPASNLGKWFWAEHLHITHTHTPTMVYRPHLFFFFLIYLLFTVLGLCCSKTFSLWWSGATLQLWCVDFSLKLLLFSQSMDSRARRFIARNTGASWPAVRGIFPDEDWTYAPHTVRQIIKYWTIREVLGRVLRERHKAFGFTITWVLI